MTTQIFDTPINTGDQSFDRVLRAGLPVAALFWSNPLDVSLDAELSARARECAGQLLVVKIKTDDNPQLTQRFDIRATPILITLRDGCELTRVEYPTPTDMRQHVDYMLGRGPLPSKRGDTASAESQRPAAGTPANADGKPLVITDATLEHDVLQAKLPVIVDFWAAWCGPCRMIAPALEKIAAEYGGRVRVAKLNVDENQRTAMQYQVQSIPLLLFFRNGKIVDRLLGAHPEGNIRAKVDQVLKS